MCKQLVDRPFGRYRPWTSSQSLRFPNGRYRWDAGGCQVHNGSLWKISPFGNHHGIHVKSHMFLTGNYKFVFFLVVKNPPSELPSKQDPHRNNNPWQTPFFSLPTIHNDKQQTRLLLKTLGNHESFRPQRAVRRSATPIKAMEASKSMGEKLIADEASTIFPAIWINNSGPFGAIWSSFFV